MIHETTHSPRRPPDRRERCVPLCGTDGISAGAQTLQGEYKEGRKNRYMGRTGKRVDEGAPSVMSFNDTNQTTERSLGCANGRPHTPYG